MKINYHSITSRVIRSIWNIDSEYDMPKSLCSYFWTAMFSYIILIFSWPTMIINKFDFANNHIAWGYNLMTMLIGLCIIPCLMTLLHLKSIPDIYVIPIIITFGSAAGWLILIIIVLFTLGIMGVGEWVRKSLISVCSTKIKHEPKKEKKSSIFFEWIKAKKRKVCPLIEYIKEK